MSTGGDVVIDVKGLVRKYQSSSGLLRPKRETVAVDHIDLEVGRGELFGLLGPNGAGKTTTIKVLTTLLLPTEGRVNILGYDIVKDSMEVRKRIGLILGGERGLYYRITARQNLRYFADLYGVPLADRDKRIEEVLAKVDLTSKTDTRVEDFSRGMKQRLHIAKGIIHDPELIFMDEPTMGLDPQAAHEARALTKDLIADGKTILLTTHYMFEADELCDRIGVITRGKIVALNTPSGLKSLVRDTSVIEVEGFGITNSDIDALKSLSGVRTVSANMSEDKQVLRVQTEDASALLPGVTNALREKKIIGMRIKEPTLEDAYLWLVREDA